MASFMHMGDNTENLVGHEGLEGFDTVILSPVNRPRDELVDKVTRLRKQGAKKQILDPQLYLPRVAYKHLASHPYFPADLEYSDSASLSWWRDLGKSVASYAEKELAIECVCSPAVIPRKWCDEYYSACLESYKAMEEALTGFRCEPILSACVDYSSLTTLDDALKLASQLIQVEPKECYLVIDTEKDPRRELAEADSIFGLMALIAALEKAGVVVTVSHSGSDMLLWKVAGASNCATGKWWNLRRFTRTRFEESDEGGTQLPYFFEHKVLAFLREADRALIRRRCPDFLDSPLSANQFSQEIALSQLNNPGSAWIKLGWCQYLRWFCDLETSTTPASYETVRLWLSEAEQRWEAMSDQEVLLGETKNDGRWIRPWRQALSEFSRLRL